MIRFAEHDENDPAGLVVVEQVRAGDRLAGWIVNRVREIMARAANDLPTGHKLAIRPRPAVGTGIKYGVDLGYA